MSKPEQATLKLHGSAAMETFNEEVDKILAQPEQIEQVPVAWKDRTYGNLHHIDWGDSMPLYTSVPKREPSASAREMYQRGYADGFRAMEKAHGIGIGIDDE